MVSRFIFQTVFLGFQRKIGSGGLCSKSYMKQVVCFSYGVALFNVTDYKYNWPRCTEDETNGLSGLKTTRDCTQITSYQKEKNLKKLCLANSIAFKY